MQRKGVANYAQMSQDSPRLCFHLCDFADSLLASIVSVGVCGLVEVYSSTYKACMLAAGQCCSAEISHSRCTAKITPCTSSGRPCLRTAEACKLRRVCVSSLETDKPSGCYSDYKWVFFRTDIRWSHDRKATTTTDEQSSQS